MKRLESDNGEISDPQQFNHSIHRHWGKNDGMTIQLNYPQHPSHNTFPRQWWQQEERRAFSPD